MTSSDQNVRADLLTQVSEQRGEPRWLTDLRLRALRHAGELAEASSTSVLVPDIDELLGDLAAAGPGDGAPPVGSDLDGVLFCDLSTAVRDHADLVRPHLGAQVGSDADVLGALNTAVWTQGWFVHVAPGVRVERPLQIDVAGEPRRPGPFDRTLIVAERDAIVEVIDGCSAPVYSADTLQAGVVEVVVEAGADVGYAVVQNWSAHVDDEVTRRARVEAGGALRWVEGQLGARRSGRRPAVVLAGPDAATTVHSVSMAGPGRHHAVGADVTHAASRTRSSVVGRSVLWGGGTAAIGEVVDVDDANGATSTVEHDVLLLDEPTPSSAAPPDPSGRGSSAADVSVDVSTLRRLGDDQRLYLASRGLSDRQAAALFVGGFVEPITRHLHVEDAVEWTRLIEMQVGGSLG